MGLGLFQPEGPGAGELAGGVPEVLRGDAQGDQIPLIPLGGLKEFPSDNQIPQHITYTYDDPMINEFMSSIVMDMLVSFIHGSKFGPYRTNFFGGDGDVIISRIIACAVSAY